MKTQVIEHSANTHRAVSEPQQFPSLELEKRPTVPTKQAAYYLNRRPQTLRAWAMTSGTGPIPCIRVHGRLAWKTDDIRRLLGVEGV